MRSDSRKPVLLAWLDGLPEIENLYPLLALLGERRRIGLRVLLSRSAIRREPRLSELLARKGLRPIMAGSLRMKHFTASEIRAADAVIGLSDPTRDLSAKRKRSARVAAAGLPSIFLQHGALQTGVNIPFRKPMPDYASRLLMLWNPGEHEARTISEDALARHVKVGFTKVPILGDRRPSAVVERWVENHPTRLLICQSFRWGGNRYQESHIAAFYAMLDRFLAARRDCGVILRSHRGKRRASHAKFDRALEARHGNLLISEQKSGPLKGNSILDDLALVQAMVSPESTTVLDAIYAGRTVAIWDEEPILFKDLPLTADFDALMAFAADLNQSAAPCRAIRTAYGELSQNLERAAGAVESFVLTGVVQS